MKGKRISSYIHKKNTMCVCVYRYGSFIRCKHFCPSLRVTTALFTILYRLLKISTSFENVISCINRI